MLSSASWNILNRSNEEEMEEIIPHSETFLQWREASRL